MNRKKKIILVAPLISSFIRSDINILLSKYDVVVNRYNWKKKLLTPVYLLSQLLFMLKNVKSANQIVIQFGGYWSLIPAIVGRIYKVPVFIVLHGTDCAGIPHINYGSLRKKTIKIFCKISYNMASMFLPVSSSLVSVKNTFYSDDKYSYQGYKNFFPKIKTPFHVIHNGLDHTFWRPINKIKKEPNSFMAVFSNKQFVLKGGDLIISVAKKFRDYKFYIAGSDGSGLSMDIPPNVTFLGKVEQEKLREFYCKSQYYFQLSIFEGFGLALCEAMLCECIPIGSSVNIIPEIIGSCGFIVEKRDVEMLSKLVSKAVASQNKENLGKLARKRIIENYSLEYRTKELLSVMNANTAIHVP